MDAAQATGRYSTVNVNCDTLMSRRARRFVVKRWPVRVRETASGADLGVSSKYSNENFED